MLNNLQRHVSALRSPLYYITLYYNVLYYIILYYIILYYHNISYILYYIILYRIVSYHIILYYILYYIILYIMGVEIFFNCLKLWLIQVVLDSFINVYICLA